jgi:hypothetical protein
MRRVRVAYGGMYPSNARVSASSMQIIALGHDLLAMDIF